MVHGASVPITAFDAASAPSPPAHPADPTVAASPPATNVAAVSGDVLRAAIHRLYNTRKGGRCSADMPWHSQGAYLSEFAIRTVNCASSTESNDVTRYILQPIERLCNHPRV